MESSHPHLILAGEREAGVLCSGCGGEIQLDDRAAACPACGDIHHESCWYSAEGCCSYHCRSGNTPGKPGAALISISKDELAAAVPLPSRESAYREYAGGERDMPDKRWNRTAVWAIVIAVLGIPLFGLITGMVAMIVGCIALVSHASNRKGVGLAVAGILLGLADVVGWAFGLHHFFGEHNAAVAFQEFSTPDASTLRGLPEPLSRAMRANVMVFSDAGFARQSLGSGVILRIRDGLTWIVTNRHVVDHNYSDDTTVPENLDSLSNISIRTLSELAVPATVEWLAPHGVDLAIVSARLDTSEIVEAHWNTSVAPQIGENVFAVGNPHGLGWTHSAGQVSQVRQQRHGMYSLRVLQTTAALNPGNSGGGLYDEEGWLIGINTLTGDKRVAEGLGFSIALPTLFDLLPQSYHLSDQNPETPPK